MGQYIQLLMIQILQPKLLQEITIWLQQSVTDMSELFRDATSFNEDIGHWDTSNVTDM